MTETVVSGTYPAFTPLASTPSAAQAKDQAEVLYRMASDVQGDASALRRRASQHDLEVRAEDVARRLGPTEMLERLSDAGMAWRDVARLAGVSVPAVQKWRRGGDLRGENRLRLATIVAVLDVLGTHFIPEGVSWLEMPVKAGVELTRLDLIAEGREDLLLVLLSHDGDDTTPTAVLNEFDPDWRTNLVDADWEPFVAADGYVSIRPR